MPFESCYLALHAEGNTVRIFGWTFLVGFLGDAMLSLLSDFVPSLLSISDPVSYAVMLLALLAFVFALTGQLQPRSIFVLTPLFYLALLVFGVFVGITLAVTISADQLAGMDSPEAIKSKLPWFGGALLIVHAIWIVVAMYALIAYARDSQGPLTPLSPPADL